MRTIARRLMAEEHGAKDPTEADAAFRVCHKLGKSLSVLTGTKGFAALLLRAIALAAVEVPWLAELRVDAIGTLIIPASATQATVSAREAARGGLALVAHLLELLATFIGEALTLRLVQQVWPKAALNRENS